MGFFPHVPLLGQPNAVAHGQPSSGIVNERDGGIAELQSDLWQHDFAIVAQLTIAIDLQHPASKSTAIFSGRPQQDRCLSMK
jgi:hypothetical protein